MIEKNNIFPLGIGTWKIDTKNIKNALEALEISISNGQNYMSLYMQYEDGEIVRQCRQFINLVGKENLFINTSLEGIINSTDEVDKQLDEYLATLGLDYVDSLQIHHPWFARIPLIEVYGEIKKQVKAGKVRYIGISNASPDQVKEINKEIKLDFFEGLYNLECRKYEDLGVFDYCNEHNIKIFCFQPLRRNRTAGRNYPILVELSQKYEKTQNQIILNWILKEKKIGAIVKSTNIQRIAENLSSMDFSMSEDDYNKLNAFRAEEFDKIVIDWAGNGGITIDQLANQFK